MGLTDMVTHVCSSHEERAGDSVFTGKFLLGAPA
jgi:hypothetical protein